MAFLHDHLTKMRQSCIKILAIHFCFGPDNINCHLQLSTIDFLEKVVDFNAIINAIVAMISKALFASVACLALWSRQRNC